jgi:hypothetical protein
MCSARRRARRARRPRSQNPDIGTATVFMKLLQTIPKDDAARKAGSLICCSVSAVSRSAQRADPAKN